MIGEGAAGAEQLAEWHRSVLTCAPARRGYGILMRATTNISDGRKSSRTRFLYIGGRLAVDFVNTSYPILGAETAPLVWEEFVEFLSGAKVISPARAGDLLAWRHSAPQALPALMKRALQLRSAIRSSVEARVAGTPVGEETAEAINEVLRITEGHD